MLDRRKRRGGKVNNKITAEQARSQLKAAQRDLGEIEEAMATAAANGDTSVMQTLERSRILADGKIRQARDILRQYGKED